MSYRIGEVPTDLFCLFLYCLFGTGSHKPQTNLKPLVWLRLTWSWFSSLCCPNAGLPGALQAQRVSPCANLGVRVEHWYCTLALRSCACA